MEKTNFCTLLLVFFFVSLCNSQDYKYDDYDQYYDYTDDYSQQLNDYYNQNLLAPPNPRPSPILPPTTSPLGKIIFFLLQIRWNIRLFTLKSKQIKLWHWKHICISSKYMTCVCLWKCIKDEHFMSINFAISIAERFVQQY